MEPVLAPPAPVVRTAPDTAPVVGRPRRALVLTRWAAVVLVATLVLGNLGLVLTSFVLHRAMGIPEVPVAVEGVAKIGAVSPNVWRGAAPELEGYRSLAADGVTTVVDLRAEEDAAALDDQIRATGLQVVHLPIRDGQVPTPDQVDTFLDVVGASTGPVFLHCGAGVGRTGAMAAAYLVATGQADGAQALARNLAVGPPSLEQIFYAAGFEASEPSRPPFAVVALSRFLDAPRRIWHNL